ncbi:hypothetical protein Droror1_Dr00027586 [Drosera rotundifolia]
MSFTCSFCQVLESLPLPNIKWICPTAPTRPVALLGFDIAQISEDNPDDFEGLDASAAHIANLLSAEPADGDEVVHCTFGKKICSDPWFSWISESFIPEI